MIDTNGHPLCHICNTECNFLMQKDGFDEYLCPHCRLSFVFPQPQAEWLKEKVYSFESGYQGNKHADLGIVSEDTRSTKILDMVASEKPGGKFLDVGCSNGQFMFWARKRGLQCSGVEINTRTADIAIANGFDVFKGFLEHAPFEKQAFDVIFVGDVIEHVNDPRRLMNTCKSLLKPDGILIISTPNVDCFWSNSTLGLYRVFGIPWSSATPPHHLYQFSYDNVNVLLKELGFSATGSHFEKPPSLWYEFGSLHLLKRWKQKRTVSAYLFMIFAFGLYTLVCGANIVFTPFRSKDFKMAVFYKLV